MSEPCVASRFRWLVLRPLALFPNTIRPDLAGLFERHCHGVIFVMHPFGRKSDGRADIWQVDSDFPEKHDLIEEWKETTNRGLCRGNYLRAVRPTWRSSGLLEPQALKVPARWPLSRTNLEIPLC